MTVKVKHKKEIRRIASLLTASLIMCWSGALFALFDVKEARLQTGGDVRGLAMQDYYVYVAKGAGGLTIINLSNPKRFRIKGSLLLPGSFIEQVAVSEHTAVITDTKNNQVHAVDVWDTLDPQLIGSVKVKGDTPRVVAMQGGSAFVVEYGAKPSQPGYFSGIEVFDYTKTLKSVQLMKLKGIRDIAVTADYVFAAAGNQLYTFARKPVGFDTKPVAQLKFPAGEQIHSITLLGTHIFAFGKKQLYAIDINLPSRTGPIILDQQAVAGALENRRVDAAEMPGVMASSYSFILLTTLKEYGLFFFDSKNNKLYPFDMFDLDTASWLSLRNVYQAGQNEGVDIFIYDAALSRYHHPGVLKGGTLGFGAIGTHGLGYVRMIPSSP